MVWPTMSGMMVERRDQVLMTFLSPAALRCVHLLEQVVVHKRTLLQAARHSVTFPLSSYRRAPRVRRLRTIILSESLLRARVRPSG